MASLGYILYSIRCFVWKIAVARRNIQDEKIVCLLTICFYVKLVVFDNKKQIRNFGGNV
jgi:hypothetical protein